MKKIFSILMLSLSISSFQGVFSGEIQYGYISYSTFNIGDDIQSIAARRFLPSTALPVNREYIGEYQHATPVKTIVNGWYMHTQYNLAFLSQNPPPKKFWPPSPSIDPLLISIHISSEFAPFAFTPEAISYMQQHGPVGARDYITLFQLKKHRIPSYFSGCLTLTLENPYTTRDDIIYAVDIDEESMQYIRSKTNTPVQSIQHKISPPLVSSNEERIQYAEHLLDLYRKAKCVVTSRLHAALPCLAFKTPVLFLTNNEQDSRFVGLIELTRHGTKENLLKGTLDYNFNNPPANPDTYLPIRKRLIKTVTNWVKRPSH